MHVNDADQQKLLSPTENTDPETPRQWSCTVSHICLFKLCLTGSFSTYELIYPTCYVVVSGAGSGVCELTNQKTLGILEGGALKRQELKQRGNTELQHSARQACKLSLAQTQNNITNLKLSIICLL